MGNVPMRTLPISVFCQYFLKFIVPSELESTIRFPRFFSNH